MTRRPTRRPTRSSISPSAELRRRSAASPESRRPRRLAREWSSTCRPNPPLPQRRPKPPLLGSRTRSARSSSASRAGRPQGARSSNGPRSWRRGRGRARSWRGSRATPGSPKRRLPRLDEEAGVCTATMGVRTTAQRPGRLSDTCAGPRRSSTAAAEAPALTPRAATTKLLHRRPTSWAPAEGQASALAFSTAASGRSAAGSARTVRPLPAGRRSRRRRW
jgi:hypothetical protein